MTFPTFCPMGNESIQNRFFSLKILTNGLRHKKPIIFILNCLNQNLNSEVQMFFKALNFFIHPYWGPTVQIFWLLKDSICFAGSRAMEVINNIAHYSVCCSGTALNGANIDTYSTHFLVFSPPQLPHGFCHKWIILSKLDDLRNIGVFLFTLCFIPPAGFPGFFFFCFLSLSFFFFFCELFDWIPCCLVPVKKLCIFPPSQGHCSLNQPDWWSSAIIQQMLHKLLYSQIVNINRNRNFEVSCHGLG